MDNGCGTFTKVDARIQKSFAAIRANTARPKKRFKITRDGVLGPMSLTIKISGGTPKTGKSLCVTCKHAQIVRGQNMEEHIECSSGLFNSTRNRVPFRVGECNTYHPSNVPWLHEMKDIAWNIEARKRGPVGFESPESTDMEVIVTPPKKRGDDNIPDF